MTTELEEWFCPECDTHIVERNRRGPHLSACRRSMRARGESVTWKAETGIALSSTKVCFGCGEEKPNDTQHWYSEQSICIPCFNKKTNNRYATDEPYRLAMKERSRIDREQNRERHKAQRLWRQYHITQEQYDAMLEAQNWGCAICGGVNSNGKALAVDHDHRCGPGKKSCGKCVRGLLCIPCNLAIGRFKDSPHLLRRAIEYIENFLCR